MAVLSDLDVLNIFQSIFQLDPQSDYRFFCVPVVRYKDQKGSGKTKRVWGWEGGVVANFVAVIYK